MLLGSQIGALIKLRKERAFYEGCGLSSTFRLQDEICDLAEWAFGSQGIRSLRTIAVGDFSATAEYQANRLRNLDSHGRLSLLKGRDKRMAYAVEKYRDFGAILSGRLPLLKGYCS